MNLAGHNFYRSRNRRTEEIAGSGQISLTPKRKILERFSSKARPFLKRRFSLISKRTNLLNQNKIRHLWSERSQQNKIIERCDLNLRSIFDF